MKAHNGDSALAVNAASRFRQPDGRPLDLLGVFRRAIGDILGVTIAFMTCREIVVDHFVRRSVIDAGSLELAPDACGPAAILAERLAGLDSLVVAEARGRVPTLPAPAMAKSPTG